MSRSQTHSHSQSEAHSHPANQHHQRWQLRKVDEDPILSENIPTFDDSRIRNHPDKVMLARVKRYFKTFTTGDLNGMRAMEADDYTVTDTPIGATRLQREAWFTANGGMTSLLSDLKVEAIDLHGSSNPGDPSILEHFVWFTLVADPPKEAMIHFPPGIKKGDRSGMLMCSIILWNEAGKITKELEYGRFVWDGLDMSAFAGK